MMSGKEKKLIFGTVLEELNDIRILDETKASAVNARVAHEKENIAKKQAEKANIEAMKNPTPENIAKSNTANKNANQTKHDADAIEREVTANKKEDDVVEKDPLTGEVISRKKSLQEDAAENAQRQIDRINLNIRKENEAHQKEVMRLKDQKESYEKVKASYANNTSSEETQELAEENSIEKGEDQVSLSTDSLNTEETEGNKTDELKDNNEENISEGARIQLNVAEPGVEQVIKQEAFAKMLFNGSSGNALKFFIYGEINNGNREEIAIAKKMKEDKEVKSIINKIKWLLSRAANGKFVDKDYMDLKVQKSKFRQAFYKYKKDNA